MDDYTKQRIVQSRGPAIEFAGRLIASDEFEVRRDNSTMRLEIYETQGGALIAVTRGEAMQGGEVRDIVAAEVVPPMEGLTRMVPKAGDIPTFNYERADVGVTDAMRFAVMDFFDWSDRARSMVRKQLKWSLKMTVE